MLTLSALFLSVLLSASGTSACNQYSSRFQTTLQGVCVCNTTAKCDSVSNEYLNLKPHQVGVYTTSKDGDRLAFSTVSQENVTEYADLVIQTNVTHQSILGFGGAFTDAAAINIYKLAPSLQQSLLDAYYTSKGIEYTIGRVPIASVDFSTSIYSYNNVSDDFEMKNFSIDVDRAPHSHKLQLIQRALNTTSREVKLFASSWAPPTWMVKENRTENCQIKEQPGRPYWKALALYYAKFFEAYRAENIHFWGMTTQNEPGKPIIQPSQWQSLRISPEEERDFIKYELGPLMKERFPELKIIAHDDQKPNLIKRMQPVLNDPEARKYVHGVGIHWYETVEYVKFNTGGSYGTLKQFHEKYPDIFILPTEACEGYLPKWLGTGMGVYLQDPWRLWQRAENYARDIINDVANFAAGYVDWNIALDTNGGPNWAGNLVDAPIIVDEEKGMEYYKQPMYYVMGHFSKFVPAGSKRVELRSPGWINLNWWNVDRVAFVTPDQRVVLILQNRNHHAMTITTQVKSADGTPRQVTVKLASKAIKTIVFPATKP